MNSTQNAIVDRHVEILRLLLTRKRVTAKCIAETLGVSGRHGRRLLTVWLNSNWPMCEEEIQRHHGGNPEIAMSLLPEFVQHLTKNK